jgi:hypothetical protein
VDVTAGLVFAISLVISISFLALVWQIKHCVSSYAWLVKGPRGIKKTLQTAATHKTLRHFMAEPPLKF